MSHAPRRFDRVVFDVDSTLVSIEGIDELAKWRGVAVASLTERAMRGDLALEEVYGLRLRRVRPGARELARLGALYVRKIVPGAAATVAALRRAGVDVRIVSGALRPALLPLMRKLRIDGSRVAAVDVRLDARGRYAGFDELSPLARADGKREVVAALLPKRGTAFVGDGATDLAARPAVERFVAFTGVASRPAVVAGADAVARDFRTLRRVLGLP
jgi:HAD superfamily phosphoserine phosphatase-like hydrolase